MFSVSKHPTPVPVQLQETSFQFYFVIHQDKRILEPNLYSPFYSFAGHWFRLIFSSNDCEDRRGVGLYLECGGLDTTGRDRKQSRIWSCTAGYQLTLLHPSKWAFLNIDPAVNEAGLLPPNFSTSIPVHPKDHVTDHQHIFQFDESLGKGRAKWASHALLQPGLFCDENHAFVVTCQIKVHDSFNNTGENESSCVSRNISKEFKKMLDERSSVVNKLFECGELLTESKAPTVVSALENEIKHLERVLEIMPPLDSFI